MHRIPAKEATWKLCRVTKKALGARAIPYIVTHDGRTIPYPDTNVHIGDTIKYDFIKNKIIQVYPFKQGTLCMVTRGRNIGRVGTIEKVMLFFLFLFLFFFGIAIFRNSKRKFLTFSFCFFNFARFCFLIFIFNTFNNKHKN